MKSRSAYFLVLFVLFVSCQKEEWDPCSTKVHEMHSYDTIFPSDYLMTYPGSWWEFSDGSVATCSAWEAVSIAEITPVGCGQLVEEDMHVLPTTSFAQYIAYDSKVVSSANYSHSTTYVPLFSTDVTFEEIYQTGVPGSSTSTTITAMGHYDVFNFDGETFYDVLHTKYIVVPYYDFFGNGPPQGYHRFYAKDIGFVGNVKINNGLQFDTIHLVNHHIEPY